MLTTRRRLNPWLLGALALFWLAAIILPAVHPEESGAHNLGAAIIAVAAGGSVLGAAARLRARHPALLAAPLVTLLLGTVAIGGAAVALHGASGVLGDALGYAAELGVIATLIAALPLPGSDGTRLLQAYFTRSKSQDEATAAVAGVAVKVGTGLIVAGAALFFTVNIGLGLGLALLGFMTRASGRLVRNGRELTQSLTSLTAADVAVLAEPLQGWKTLADALAEREWPARVTAVPVVGWSGEPAGVLLAAVAQRALAGEKGESRVDHLAVPMALVPLVDAAAPAAVLPEVLAGTAAGVALVMRDGHIVGAVTAPDLLAASHRPLVRS